MQTGKWPDRFHRCAQGLARRVFGRDDERVCDTVSWAWVLWHRCGQTPRHASWLARRAIGRVWQGAALHGTYGQGSLTAARLASRREVPSGDMALLADRRQSPAQLAETAELVEKARSVADRRGRKLLAVLLANGGLVTAASRQCGYSHQTARRLLNEIASRM